VPTLDAALADARAPLSTIHAIATVRSRHGAYTARWRLVATCAAALAGLHGLAWQGWDGLAHLGCESAARIGLGALDRALSALKGAAEGDRLVGALVVLLGSLVRRELDAIAGGVR
jgi:hypothetical protein